VEATAVIRKKPNDQKEWAYFVRASGYVDSEECEQWQHGRRYGVIVLLNKANSGVRLSDKEHDVAFITHTNCNLWLDRRGRTYRINYPHDLQTKRDAIIKRRREQA
jgi:hypothetical protein